MKHLSIQALKSSDLPVISEFQPEGWSDIIPPFLSYLSSPFCFPVKVITNGNIVGIGASIIHEDVAWLAHIIVHPEYRNQGIGRFLTEYLLENVLNRNCKTIYLIATTLGEPIYKKVGFVAETEYLFFKKLSHDFKSESSPHILPYTDLFRSEIATMDRLVSGENRFLHLEKHLVDSFVFRKEKHIEGFYIPNLGDGLIIAKTDSAGLALLKKRLSDREIAVFPVDNTAATAFLRKNTYQEFRRAKRMCFGKYRNWNPACIFNRIGGNLG